MTGINVASKQNTGLVGELKRFLLLWRQQSSKASRTRQILRTIGDPKTFSYYFDKGYGGK
jgi:hypothetical protein